MKRASYRDAIDFIALNDEAAERDPELVAGFVTVVLVASIFGVEPERVAKDVVRYRERELSTYCAKPVRKRSRIGRTFEQALKKARGSIEQRNADRIDGYDRDDIDSPSGDR